MQQTALEPARGPAGWKQRLRCAVSAVRGTPRLFLFDYAAVLFSELVLRGWIHERFWDAGLLFTALFAAVPALFFCAAASACPPRLGRAVNAVLLALAAVIYSSEIVYHKIFRTFYTVFSLLNGGQVTQFWREAMQGVLKSLAPVLLIWLGFVFYLVFKKRLGPARRLPLRKAGLWLFAVLVLHFTAVEALPLFGKESFSPYDVYYNINYLDESVQELGLLPALRLDLSRLALGFTPRDRPVLQPALDPPRVEEEPARVRQTTGPNILDIDFAAKAAGESDPELAELDEFFATVPSTNRNEKTGLFAGDNLILITAEAFSPFAVNEQLTPTLYKLVHEGFYFSDFYTNVWGTSTTDGEYCALTGLIPKGGVWSMYRVADNALPFSLARQLRLQGYSARAYHNNTFSYYHRELSHPNFGYDYKAKGNGLEVQDTWPESDLEMIDITTGEYLGDEPFITYYMTVSGHLYYNWSGNYIASKNHDLVRDLPYSENCKAYLAANIELDRAMELLLQRLDEAGVADRTVIALSADHYPYGLTNEEISEFLGHPVEENFELSKNCLILYKKGVPGETVEKSASSLDILPTLSNLFGLDYDSRLLVGRDIFSDSPPLVIFANRSWITDRARYNSKSREIEWLDGTVEDKDYIRDINRLVNNWFLYSAQIIDKDYYATLNLPASELPKGSTYIPEGPLITGERADSEETAPPSAASDGPDEKEPARSGEEAHTS